MRIIQVDRFNCRFSNRISPIEDYVIELSNNWQMTTMCMRPNTLDFCLSEDPDKEWPQTNENDFFSRNWPVWRWLLYLLERVVCFCHDFKNNSKHTHTHNKRIASDVLTHFTYLSILCASNYDWRWKLFWMLFEKKKKKLMPTVHIPFQCFP